MNRVTAVEDIEIGTGQQFIIDFGAGAYNFGTVTIHDGGQLIVYSNSSITIRHLVRTGASGTESAVSLAARVAEGELADINIIGRPGRDGAAGVAGNAQLEDGNPGQNGFAGTPAPQAAFVVSRLTGHLKILTRGGRGGAGGLGGAGYGCGRGGDGGRGGDAGDGGRVSFLYNAAASTGSVTRLETVAQGGRGGAGGRPGVDGPKGSAGKFGLSGNAGKIGGVEILPNLKRMAVASAE